MLSQVSSESTDALTLVGSAECGLPRSINQKELLVNSLSKLRDLSQVIIEMTHRNDVQLWRLSQQVEALHALHLNVVRSAARLEALQILGTR